MSDAEHERTAVLLNEVFGHEPPTTAAEIRWYYDGNPAGVAAVGRVEEGGRRLGNYALVPFRLRDGERELTLGLGVDLSVHPDARGSGTFRRTVEDAYARGTAAGLDGILGVANAQSAPRMVDALGWARMPPLPVRLLALRPGQESRMAAHPVTPDLLGRLDQLGVPEELPLPPSGWAPVWTREVLAWRLAKQRARYTLHLGEDLLAVSIRTAMGPVPFAVLLKVLPLRPRRRPASGGAVAWHVARHHRTPLVVHWGTNAHVRFRGLPLPRERMPSPLELVTFPFTERFDHAGLRFASFEFLDFDAY